MKKMKKKVRNKKYGENGKDTITTLFGQVISNHKYWLNNNEVQDVIDVSEKGSELD